MWLSQAHSGIELYIRKHRETRKSEGFRNLEGKLYRTRTLLNDL